MKKNEILNEIQSLQKIKLKYFRTFYDISIQQKKTANSHSNLEIESLLLKKDNIITKIKELESRITFLLKNNPALESVLVGDSVVKSIAQQIKEVISKIVPIEKEVTEILEKHKSLVKEHISTIRRGRALITGYGGDKFIKPRFVDYKLQ